MKLEAIERYKEMREINYKIGVYALKFKIQHHPCGYAAYFCISIINN